ncbi:MAG: HAMP domain-containing sensor histidine kinase [Gemmatimonadales bacterium]
MTFRARLSLAFAAVALVPVALFALAVRKEVGDRLTAQYQRRVASMVAAIEADLAQEGAYIGRTLGALRDGVLADNRFRRAALGGSPADRGYMLDYAGEVMRLTGLSMLQIQDDSGRILSSGHFRNEYDRLEPALPRLLATTPNRTSLVEARTPDGPFIALAALDTFRLADRRFSLVGGASVERRLLGRLVREAGLGVSLVYPGGVIGDSSRPGAADAASDSGDAVAGPDAASLMVEELSLPFVDASAGEIRPARFRVTYPLTELHALRRSIDVWFAIAAGLTAVVALFVASWLSGRMSRPLAELARKTSRIDLDRLDVDFRSARKDEIGALSRLLGAMTERLRASAGRIKEAERRATLGELARQVNHDIKNGLMPIRNVFRHLAQVAQGKPEELPRVFNERHGTIDSSIGYLENLASNYARLTPRFEREACDVSAVARQVVAQARTAAGAEVRLEVADEHATVMGDALALRRILENLVDNALDSLGAGTGTVTVSTRVLASESSQTTVQVIVTDTGVGMNDEQVARVFDDFYTTKEGGTGLGLSIVRRLVMDLNGSIKVESEPGRGSRFVIELPGEGRASSGGPRSSEEVAR